MPMNQLLAQRPTQRPLKPRKPTNRPLCHASDKETYLAFCDQYRAFCQEYRAASFEYRSGNRSVVFPQHSIPPSLLYLTSA
jgi:hypothetical protein